MNIPKAFISYSHDSQSHKKWVLDLATRLRNAGVDAILDQWELKAGDDLPHFMEQNLAACDYVLMICTEKYVQKANGGLGGVGYEKMIVTSDLMKGIDSNKVIPVIRQEGTRNVPTFLKTKLFVDFSKSDDFEFGFDELVRTLHNAPLYKKPEIGNNPFESIEKIRPEKTGDALPKLMALVVRDFEGGRDYSNYGTIVARMSMSRIMLDMLIESALEQGLITQYEDRDLQLSSKGKFYAIEHKLISA
jgi:hypothetical protein